MKIPMLLSPVLSVWVLAVTPGCSQTPATPPSSPSAAIPSPSVTRTLGTGPLDHAQPKLPTVKLWLGSLELETEVASKEVEIYTGMMFREKMAETEGMIFVLPGPPQKASFYMRNTKVALSAAYIDPDGKILEIHNLNPLDESPVESMTEDIKYVLEVPQGWFQRHNIAVSAILRTEKGSLKETFYGRTVK